MGRGFRCRFVITCALASTACEQPGVKPTEAEQFCLSSLMYKPLGCHGAIDPADNYAETSLARCSMLLEHASKNGCDAELQALLECADAAECDPYLAWIFDEPDADVCASEEQQLLEACPDIPLRGD